MPSSPTLERERQKRSHTKARSGWSDIERLRCDRTVTDGVTAQRAKPEGSNVAKRNQSVLDARLAGENVATLCRNNGFSSLKRVRQETHFNYSHPPPHSLALQMKGDHLSSLKRKPQLSSPANTMLVSDSSRFSYHNLPWLIRLSSN